MQSRGGSTLIDGAALSVVAVSEVAVFYFSGQIQAALGVDGAPPSHNARRPLPPCSSRVRGGSPYQSSQKRNSDCRRVGRQNPCPIRSEYFVTSLPKIPRRLHHTFQGSSSLNVDASSLLPLRSPPSIRCRVAGARPVVLRRSASHIRWCALLRFLLAALPDLVCLSSLLETVSGRQRAPACITHLFSLLVAAASPSPLPPLPLLLHPSSLPPSVLSSTTPPPPSQASTWKNKSAGSFSQCRFSTA